MFDHEKLDVYQISLQFVAWVNERVSRLKGYQRHARDELIRASQSIPRNIAEGNGKLSSADRRKTDYDYEHEHEHEHEHEKISE